MIFDNRMERREEKVRKDRKRRTKVSAMGRLTREMMSDVMETALKKPIQTGEFRKNPVEPASGGLCV